MRRRGVDVLKLDMFRTGDDRGFQGRLRLRGIRSVESLMRHIENIEEVQQIALIQSASIGAA